VEVDRRGALDFDRLREAVTDQTALVSIMWANNETGVIQPIAEIARLTRDAGGMLVVDAVQAAAGDRLGEASRW
jgi:cysteine desulfurase